MDCFVLGSGGMMPMPKRRLTSVAVRLGGAVYVFDCGEGTQVPYKELHLGLRPLRLVAITHLHADHVLGLFGLLMLRAQMPDPEPLTVIGPPGLDRLIGHVREDLDLFINFEIRILSYRGDDTTPAYEDELVRILWRPMEHTTFCLGYRLEEHARPGRFDPRAAEAMGVPRGPLWGQLQQGHAVRTPAGERVVPGQVSGSARRGRHVAFVTDTAPCPSLPALLAGVDLAFVEGMFHPEHREEAGQKKHLTVDEACSLARGAGVAELVLVHLSPRYSDEDLPRLTAVARAHHHAVQVGTDGQRLQVPFPPDAV